jgi:protein-S-isoprenylcysteine O-methyltransferase Ste14
MYLAVAAMIGGRALVLASLGILVWLVVIGAAVWSFVTLYEQPTLRRRYGSSYAAYCAAVPGWWPRLTPVIMADHSSEGQHVG